jgi:hypothetical protein
MTENTCESLIDQIINESYRELNDIMENWCKSYEAKCSGGTLRQVRGEDIETFVKGVITRFKEKFNINVLALTGSDDKKKLKRLNKNNREVSKLHQVDVHVYKDEKFIACIECKSYLDSCFYIRACDDFELFKKYNYDIKKYIFVLENSISDNTKDFTDDRYDYVCDDIFYMLDGKRSSENAVYKKDCKKPINKKSLSRFIESMETLLVL